MVRTVRSIATAVPMSATPPRSLSRACRARIHDRGGDLLLLAAGRGRQAAIWYSA